MTAQNNCSTRTDSGIIPRFIHVFPTLFFHYPDVVLPMSTLKAIIPTFENSPGIQTMSESGSMNVGRIYSKAKKFQRPSKGTGALAQRTAGGINKKLYRLLNRHMEDGGRKKEVKEINRPGFYHGR